MLDEDIKKFFSQYREIYGDEIYIKPEIVEGLTALSRPPSVTTGSKRERLLEFYNSIKDCTKCGLGFTRTNFVFGTGSPEAKMMFIGEAPGRDEDLQGKPFVGRAGQLLTKILNAIQLERKDVFIANILKCRPPNNRDPQTDERDMCFPYLLRQIEIIQPKVIVLLGRIAAQEILGTKDSMASMRGKVHYFMNSKLIITYHPAALLRNPHWKKSTWEDVQLARRIYDE